MADEKRRDEYDIELGEKNGKSFSPPRPAEPIRYTPAPSSSLQNNPVRCTPRIPCLRFQPSDDGPMQKILPVISYCASSILM